MYIPDGWHSTEQDAGEFNLQNPAFPDGSGLFFWRDVIPVEPDVTHVTTVPSTVTGARPIFALSASSINSGSFTVSCKAFCRIWAGS